MSILPRLPVYQRTRRHWRIIALGALAVIGVAVGLLALDTRRHSSSPSAPAAQQQITTPAQQNTAPFDLTSPAKKDIAMQLVSSAENSSLDWRAQYGYIEDISDGRGYTGGIIGFTSGTGDMLEVVEAYTKSKPYNPLARYIPALRAVNGSNSHDGLDDAFISAWKSAAGDPPFRAAQDQERDRIYFDPAVSQAKADGLHALGQFIYYDALVMHGPGNDPTSFGGIRATAVAHTRPPRQGGDETMYLDAFLDARLAAMRADPSHQQTDRVDREQRVFLHAGNLNLNPPLHWTVYDDTYDIAH